MKLHEIMRLDRIARAAKDVRKPAPAAEVVKDIPMGFFIMRQSGRPDCQMHNSATFGLIGPVKSSFFIGGQMFTRARDKHDELIPLKVFIKPAPQIGNSYGNFTHGDFRIVDSDVIVGFSGDFEFTPMK
jgi:hypothetical protein